MPPKRATKSTTKCDVCAAAIVEGKEDALQCDGACQMWFHRYCVGMSQSQFKHLASTSKPFVCPFCSHDVHQAVVCELQSEITALKNEVKALSEAKQALCDEVRLLKATVATLDTHNEPEEARTASAGAAKPTHTWATAVKSSRSRMRRQAASNAILNPATESRAASNKTSSSSRPKQLLTPVPGKRRIWGTLKVCSASTVKKVILQFGKLPEEATLQVKRKFKTRGDNNRVVKWWHVISADENILSTLDRNWENVALQTSWQIEPCLIASHNNDLPKAEILSSANGSSSCSFPNNKPNTPTQPTPNGLDSRTSQVTPTSASSSPVTKQLTSEQSHDSSTLHISTLCSSVDAGQPGSTDFLGKK